MATGTAEHVAILRDASLRDAPQDEVRDIFKAMRMTRTRNVHSLPHLPRHHRPRGQHGLAHWHAGKSGAFLEPALRRRMATQGLALRIAQRPADRLEIGIAR